MNVKIDTKEKFNVFTPIEASLSANMTHELNEKMLGILQTPVAHVILNLTEVQEIEQTAAMKLMEMQQLFYEQNCSFIICCLNKNVEQYLDQLEILELMNVTPTESEAWDILQMEEIERELLNDDETV
jgi:anti-anti-sigma regulatory factor